MCVQTTNVWLKTQNDYYIWQSESVTYNLKPNQDKWLEPACLGLQRQQQRQNHGQFLPDAPEGRLWIVSSQLTHATKQKCPTKMKKASSSKFTWSFSLISYVKE